jgi:uncharacterized repeat protein (TIGR01451 family)
MISSPTDPTPGDNSDSEALDVGQPDLSITKTADSNLVQSGFPVTFTIAVTNSGDGDATSVTVTDLLPPVRATSDAGAMIDSVTRLGAPTTRPRASRRRPFGKSAE